MVQIFRCRTFKMPGARLARSAFVLAAILLSLSFGTAARAACVPNENQAAFYIDAGYNGGCVVKDLGSYANAGEIGLPNEFDLVASPRPQRPGRPLQGR